MLGGFFKLTLSFCALLLFVTIFWQVSIADALPTLAADENLVKSNDDATIHTGGPVVKRSLHSTVDQTNLIDRLYSPSRHRTYNKNFRAAKRMKAVFENRLKRFRMLDQDEFQEMLKSLSQQSTDDQLKTQNGIDTIGGMQLENYWSPN